MASKEFKKWQDQAAVNASQRPAGLDIAWLRGCMNTDTQPADKSVQVRAVDAGGVPSEWVWARNADPARRLLYLHGGGYISGTAGNYREFIAVLSQVTGCLVLVANYGVGPERPFPASVRDAHAAFRWMRDNSPYGASGAARTFIAGDSAGGGLTLATLVALRDAGQPLADAGIMISAYTDLAHTGDSVRTRADADMIMSASWLPIFADVYLQGADPRHPLASPLYADLAGLPPLLIQVGDAEILRDDSVRVAEKARAAGVRVELEVWSEMPHVWHIHPFPEGRQAVEKIARFISVFE